MIGNVQTKPGKLNISKSRRVEMVRYRGIYTLILGYSVYKLGYANYISYWICQAYCQAYYSR